MAVPVTASDSFVNRSSIACRELDKNIGSKHGNLHAEMPREEASKNLYFLMGFEG
jgi:hypothetical protein